MAVLRPTQEQTIHHFIKFDGNRPTTKEVAVNIDWVLSNGVTSSQLFNYRIWTGSLTYTNQLPDRAPDYEDVTYTQTSLPVSISDISCIEVFRASGGASGGYTPRFGDFLNTGLTFGDDGGVVTTLITQKELLIPFSAACHLQYYLALSAANTLPENLQIYGDICLFSTDMIGNFSASNGCFIGYAHNNANFVGFINKDGGLTNDNVTNKYTVKVNVSFGQEISSFRVAFLNCTRLKPINLPEFIASVQNMSVNNIDINNHFSYLYYFGSVFSGVPFDNIQEGEYNIIKPPFVPVYHDALDTHVLTNNYNMVYSIMHQTTIIPAGGVGVKFDAGVDKVYGVSGLVNFYNSFINNTNIREVKLPTIIYCNNIISTVSNANLSTFFNCIRLTKINDDNQIKITWHPSITGDVTLNFGSKSFNSTFGNMTGLETIYHPQILDNGNNLNISVTTTGNDFMSNYAGGTTDQINISGQIFNSVTKRILAGPNSILKYVKTLSVNNFMNGFAMGYGYTSGRTDEMEIDFGDINFDNIHFTRANNMQQMFYRNTLIKNIKLPLPYKSDFNQNLLNQTFYGCTNLEKVEFTRDKIYINPSISEGSANQHTASQFLANCPNLQEINMFDIEADTNTGLLQNMFTNCFIDSTKLRKVRMPRFINFNTSDTTNRVFSSGFVNAGKYWYDTYGAPELTLIFDEDFND